MRSPRAVSPRIVPLEFLKAARGQWLTLEQLAEITGAHRNTLHLCARELMTQGFIVRRTQDRGQRAKNIGKAPNEYTLAAQWIGGER